MHPTKSPQMDGGGYGGGSSFVMQPRSGHDLDEQLSIASEKLEKRQQELESATEEHEALHMGFLEPEQAQTLRKRIQYLEGAISDQRFKTHQARERELKSSEQLRTLEKQKADLPTHVEILEQAVHQMHYVIDDMWRNLLENIPEECKSRTLIGRGDAAGVPIFLRYSGSCRSFHISKLHTELVIRQLWALKTVEDRQRVAAALSPFTLAQFLHHYVSTSFETEKSKMEFCYNFVDALEHYISDADIKLFYKILFGQISEYHYYDGLAMLGSLKKLLEEMDVADGCRDGLIDQALFFMGMRAFFPLKTEARHTIIREIVFRSKITGGFVDSQKLLMETESGDQSDFLECVRTQYLEEVFEYPIAIENALRKAAQEFRSKLAARSSSGLSATSIQSTSVRSDEIPSVVADTSSDELPAGQIAAVLREVDCRKPSQEIQEYMRRGMDHAETGGEGGGQYQSGDQSSKSRDAASPSPQPNDRCSGSRASRSSTAICNADEMVNITRFLVNLNTELLAPSNHYVDDVNVDLLGTWLIPNRLQ